MGHFAFSMVKNVPPSLPLHNTAEQETSRSKRMETGRLLLASFLLYVYSEKFPFCVEGKGWAGDFLLSLPPTRGDQEDTFDISESGRRKDHGTCTMGTV